MKGLLIEFNVTSGVRPGGIEVRTDRGLVCHGWQNLATTPAIEIRVIVDNRDISQYEGIAGIIILGTDDEIQQAIDQHVLALEGRPALKLRDIYPIGG